MRKRGSRLSHRIAGGAIVVREDRILLVRYRDQDGGTFLVAPGGGALEHESVSDAAVRETFEETGVRVVPGHALLIEDILTDRFKMWKVWFACSVAAGEALQSARRVAVITCWPTCAPKRIRFINSTSIRRQTKSR